MSLKVNFDIENVEVLFYNSYNLIEKFNLKNNIKLNKFIINAYFANDLESGSYVYENNDKVCEINLNIENCFRARYNTMYYPYDLRIENVIIHEYCHFLDDIYGLLDVYKNYNFPQFFIKYKNKREELAEILTIFLLNPYLLKILDLDRYNFFNDRFKPVKPCTDIEFFKQYCIWNRHEKMVFKRLFNLKLNVKKRIINVKKNNK
jgi:hypothetical protein